MCVWSYGWAIRTAKANKNYSNTHNTSLKMSAYIEQKKQVFDWIYWNDKKTHKSDATRDNQRIRSPKNHFVIYIFFNVSVHIAHMGSRRFIYGVYVLLIIHRNRREFKSQPCCECSKHIDMPNFSTRYTDGTLLMTPQRQLFTNLERVYTPYTHTKLEDILLSLKNAARVIRYTLCHTPVFNGIISGESLWRQILFRWHIIYSFYFIYIILTSQKNESC